MREGDYTRIIVESPSYTSVPEKVALVFEATQRFVPKAKAYDGLFIPVACMKPDLIRRAEQLRSYDVNILRTDGDYLFVFPGKMTAAPYVTDRLVQVVFAESSQIHARIAQRPCDMYKFDQDDRENESSN